MAITKGISKQELDAMNEKFNGKEIDKVLGINLLTHANKLSGSRQNLFYNHAKKCLNLNNPETPYVYTGYELATGNKAGSVLKADSDYKIIAKIPKHMDLPNMSYLLVLQDLMSNIYTTIEIDHYKHLSEMYGYMLPLIEIDNYQEGFIIRKGENFIKGSSVDQYGNYSYGINANVAYVNTLNTAADAILISDEFAKRASFHTIEKTEILINLNDILLNIHGDMDHYRILPKMGEEIVNGILCARRKINLSLASSILTTNALNTIIESDELFRGKGRLIDIDIRVNRHELLLDSNDPYLSQLKYLYENQLRYNKAIYDALHPLLLNKNTKYTHLLRITYENAKKYINNVYLDSNENIQYQTNNGKFEFIYLSLETAYYKELDLADKLSNRSGAKGVISAVIPKEQMYRDQFGNYCDILIAGKGIISRLNIAQSYEQELNFISNRIVHKLRDIPEIEDKFDFILEFISKINQDQADELAKYWKKLNKVKKFKFLDDIDKCGQIYIYQPPFYGNITLDKLAELYEYYDIKPGYCRFQMKFKQNEYHKDNLLSEEEYDKNQRMYNYIMSEYLDANKFTVDKYFDSLDNKEIIKDSKSNKEYIKTGVKTTSKDYFESKNNSIWKKLQSGLKIIKNTFDELDEKQFNSPESRIKIDENGDIVRDFRTVSPLIIGKMYIIVLKQIADTGFSARSIGSVNPLGDPIKDGKIDVGYPYSTSPIKISFMDICNIGINCSMDIVHRFKSIHASNPELRREMCEILLTKDPFRLHNLSIKLEETYDDISSRLFKSYFFGIAIMFLENGEKDPFELFDYPEYANLNRIYKRYGKIDIPLEELRK